MSASVLAVSDTVAWGLPAAALIASLLGVVVSVIMQSRTLVRAADAQRVTNLEKDLDRARQDLEIAKDELAEHKKLIDDCERGRVELKGEVARLNAREVELMRRLVRLEGDAR